MLVQAWFVGDIGDAEDMPGQSELGRENARKACMYQLLLLHWTKPRLEVLWTHGLKKEKHENKKHNQYME